MELFVIALRDIKANMYGKPGFATNIGAEIRAFGDQVKDPQSGTLNKHPEDFELYQLAIYDDNTGKFREEVKQLAVGGDYKA